MPYPTWPVEIESSANDTLLFKTVCPDLETFSSSEPAIDVIDNIKVYDGEGALITNQVWLKEVYRLLYRHYRNSEIAYTNESDFLYRLWEIIEMEAPNYMLRKARYQKLMSLTTKEIMSLGINISNFIENTNDRAEDVFEPLEKINSQNSELHSGATVARLKSQLNVLQARLIQEFVTKFRTLFIRLTNSSSYFGY